MDVQIRRVLFSDLDAVIDLVKPMWIMHATKEQEILDETYLRELDARSYFVLCFEKPDTNALYVVLDGDTIVGCCRVEIIELEGMFHEKRAAYIDDVVVKESYRGQGIGTKLLEKAELFARHQNIRLLKTRVYEFNSAAQKMIRKKDFRQVYSESYKVLG